jgi:hypothetical protein
MTIDIDHTHECRGCGDSIDCGTPNDECNDYPGDCEACEAPESQGCECEIDWRCPLHQGQFTPEELMLDWWASEQDEADRRGGWL